MALRDFFFDRGTTETPSRSPSAQPHPASTQIGYDPLLIGQLRRDHHRLLDVFAAVQSLLTGRDYAGVQRKLGEMRILLQEHLLLTNNTLYLYLGRRWADDADRNSFINAVRRDMLETGREILDSLRTYSAVRLDDQSAEMFQEELLQIGTAMMQRMEREEAGLFPLYKRGA